MCLVSPSHPTAPYFAKMLKLFLRHFFFCVFKVIRLFHVDFDFSVSSKLNWNFLSKLKLSNCRFKIGLLNNRTPSKGTKFYKIIEENRRRAASGIIKTLIGIAGGRVIFCAHDRLLRFFARFGVGSGLQGFLRVLDDFGLNILSSMVEN